MTTATIFDLEAHTAVQRRVMNLDLGCEVGQQFFQAQANLFRRRPYVGKNENGLPGSDQLRQFAKMWSPRR